MGKTSKILHKLASYFLLIVMTVIVIFPFYVILITSFKDNTEAMTVPFTFWPQNGFHFDGYLKVLQSDIMGVSFLKGLKNTLTYVVPPTLVGLFMSAMASYAFVFVDFRSKRTRYAILLFSMMIPGTVTMIPSFLLFETLEWVDTALPLMVPGFFGGIGTIFFLRQFFVGLPKELIEAAKIDGLSHMNIFLRIVLPLSKPALLSLGILGFIGGYNDYFGPMMYLYDPEKYTLQMVLQFTNTSMTYDNQTIMAGCVITMLPILILYFFAQKWFIKGITMSGMKV
jgi:multiple sugar transport system permease protein